MSSTNDFIMHTEKGFFKYDSEEELNQITKMLDEDKL